MSCKECQSEIELKFGKDKNSRLESNQLCWDCDFWMDRIVSDLPKATIGGKFYYINPNEHSEFKGFGGRRFKIRFLDGTLTETTNLWLNGEIPERFRDRLPDNAEFITQT